jgi:hypothetical protein
MLAIFAFTWIWLAFIDAIPPYSNLNDDQVWAFFNLISYRFQPWLQQSLMKAWACRPTASVSTM